MADQAGRAKADHDAFAGLVRPKKAARLKATSILYAEKSKRLKQEWMETKRELKDLMAERRDQQFGLGERLCYRPDIDIRVPIMQRHHSSLHIT